MSEPLPTYKCDSCGLCCKHLLIEAEWYDVLREPRIEAEKPLATKRGSKDYPLSILEVCWVLNRQDGGGCVFLNDDNRCGIYATRPVGCVAFAVGGSKCQALRAAHGLSLLPPLLQADGALDEIAAEAAADQAQACD